MDFLIVRSTDFIVSEDSHHPTLMLTINFDVNASLSADLIYEFDFKKTNFTKLNDKLNLVDWNNFFGFDPLDHAVVLFYNFMFECFLEFIPLKCRVIKSIGHPWYDNELRKIRNLRNRSWRGYCISRSQSDLLIYQNLCVSFKDLAAAKYGSYISNIESNLTKNPSDFWKFINSKRCVRGYPSQIGYNNVFGTNASSICNLFVEYFKASYA